MTNYEKMDKLINNVNLKDIAYGDLVENKTTAYIKIGNEVIEQIAFAYDNIEQVQDFCNSIEYLTNGELNAVEWFDRLLDGLDTDEKVKNVYIEFERGV